MASIRRTLSPVPRVGNSINGEVPLVSSPLSKSSPSSSNQQYSLVNGLSSSRLDLSEYKAIERPKPKGQFWKRYFFHFFICFAVGMFIGVTPFVSMNLSTIYNTSKQQAFFFDTVPDVGNLPTYDSAENMVHGNLMGNVTLDMQVNLQELKPLNQSLPPVSDEVFRKLLIVVTPTYARSFQAYYLTRLAQTLRLVHPPLLWIVVEMTAQSDETADILRRTGVMYRHLVCDKNLSDIRDRSVHQRNLALSHIETHRLDGIVYFADDTNVYLADFFEQLRKIRRFGVWPVAKLSGSSRKKDLFAGPICNGTQVVGWHLNEHRRRLQRFHSELTGFAFNSTILWDPKRWHRPTLQHIRQLDKVRNGFLVSTFIEQLVEDESQMEGLLENCSTIMVWQLHIETSNLFFPSKWSTKNNLDVIVPLV